MQYLTHPLIKPRTIEARLYQQALLASCSKENSLVILPTGLGKTVLFVMIAAHRLYKYKEGRVILCAPTKPLMDQHINTIRNVMNIPPESVVQVSGAIPPVQRKKLWEEGVVFVCTPQTLQNDIIQKRVNMTNVVFLCLDEAHKAVGDHSYVFIADQYYKQAKHPLLLGLTASPGANVDRINEIRENLKISNIEYRDETSDDVKIYMHDIDEKWVKVSLGEEFGAIITILNNLLQQHLIALKELGIVSTTSPQNVTRTELLNLTKIVNEKLSTETDEKRTEYFRAMGLAGNSIRISYALELIETQGVPSLAKYLEKQISELQFGKGSRALKELMFSEEMKKVLEALRILQEKQIIHPKLEKLKKIIKEEVNKNPKNRILVFCHYRATAKTVSEELNKLKNVSAHWFVGQSSARNDKGLTQKQQIEIMQTFRDGLYNVLVSTSVAEEGLDIGDCDLVVFYDAVPSAIRLIQRKGRTGRRKKGTVIMLIAKGTRDEGYMWASKRQASKMKQIIKNLTNDKNAKTVVRVDNKQKRISDFFEGDKTTKENDDHKRDTEDKLSEEETKQEPEIVIQTDQSINIICDTRERNSGIIKELISKGANISFERMEIGDYICSDQVIIERKTIKDLVGSIMDKRLFVQAKALVDICSKPMIIIEGDLSLYSTSLHPHALASAISSIAVDFRIPVITTKNQKETAEIIYAIAKREQIERKRRVSIGKRKGIGLRYQMEEAIAAFPHIDQKLAVRLLKHFKTIKDLINADLIELTKVKGIGEKIAQDIIDFIYTDYTEIEKEEDIKEPIDTLEWLKRQSDENTKKKVRE